MAAGAMMAPPPLAKEAGARPCLEEVLVIPTELLDGLLGQFLGRVLLGRVPRLETDGHPIRKLTGPGETDTMILAQLGECQLG